MQKLRMNTRCDGTPIGTIVSQHLRHGVAAAAVSGCPECADDHKCADGRDNDTGAEDERMVLPCARDAVRDSYARSDSVVLRHS